MDSCWECKKREKYFGYLTASLNPTWAQKNSCKLPPGSWLYSFFFSFLKNVFFLFLMISFSLLGLSSKVLCMDFQHLSGSTWHDVICFLGFPIGYQVLFFRTTHFRFHGSWVELKIGLGATDLHGSDVPGGVMMKEYGLEVSKLMDAQSYLWTLRHHWAGFKKNQKRDYQKWLKVRLNWHRVRSNKSGNGVAEKHRLSSP